VSGIDVRLGAEAERVRLEVTDTGEGIAEHELPRLFERFHRIEGQRARSDEGSGIGLALVHELVRVQGGEVRVTSTSGAGSTFTVLVPRGARRVPVDETRPPEALARRASSSPAYIEEALAWSSNGRAAAPPPSPEQGRVAARGALRVLLADDNRDMREYLARLLGEEWDVEAVADGLAALEAARRDPPALVLADVMMPGLDGDGAGSEFTVELPAVDLLQATTAPAAAERPQRAADARGKRILIVDDNRDAALSLEHALNELGYLVEVAHDGLTALQVAQSFQPDAALLDIGLPVMDGYELAQRLREIPGPSRELRLIAITGYGQESDRQRAAAAGFHKHLVKPIDLLQLVRVVEEPRS
jgi:CheY-like chemotaxis protein